MGACVYLAIYHTFFDQNILYSLMMISGYYTFQFGLENPKLLMSKSWKEFGERADVATGKEKLIGTPWYFAAVFFPCSTLFWSRPFLHGSACGAPVIPETPCAGAEFHGDTTIWTAGHPAQSASTALFYVRVFALHSAP